MKQLTDLLLLGNPLLYKTSEPIQQSELSQVKEWVADLRNVMSEVRAKYNFGRAIAAPQLGIMKRLIYVDVDNPVVIINPKILNKSKEMISLWDDCMCFPNLLVHVKRHKEISLEFKDEKWNTHNWDLTDDMSELLQHEYDHLDGILCTMRAIDNTAFRWRATPQN